MLPAQSPGAFPSNNQLPSPHVFLPSGGALISGNVINTFKPLQRKQDLNLQHHGDKPCELPVALLRHIKRTHAFTTQKYL